ncbi:MAG: hypothetical protein WC852_04685 [Candidatus Nanoarchaeia archaeon]|jgi:hypothetical protein
MSFSYSPESLDYLHTNESLEAIVRGMDVKQKDRILVVCGSGDQAFALLEKAGYVKAVDKNETQVKYAQRRRKMLEERFIELFFPYGKGYHNRDYFSKERIARIVKKTGYLKIAKADIFMENAGLDNFNKVYLSNAATFRGNNLKAVDRFLYRIAQKLASPGIIYMASDPTINYRENMIPNGICLDTELTAIARLYERKDRTFWTPAVYRRKA